MDKIICPFNSLRRAGSKTIMINCRGCNSGDSTIFDDTCRSNIFKILQQEHGITRIVLNHAYVKVFKDIDLEILKTYQILLKVLKHIII